GGSVVGSLYYSEVANFAPCALCWYERIAMYPIAVILAIAAARRDTSVRLYVAVLCACGLAFAIYHSWIQAYPPKGGSAFCSAQSPCPPRYVWELGFISLPLMAVAAFSGIAALMALAGHAHDELSDAARDYGTGAAAIGDRIDDWRAPTNGNGSEAPGRVTGGSDG